MAIRKQIAIALLATGCPLMLWSSTLSGSAVCKVSDGKVVPIGYRSDAFPLQLLWGVSAGGFVAWMLKGELDKRKPQAPQQIKAELEAPPPVVASAVRQDSPTTLSLPEASETPLELPEGYDVKLLDKTRQGKNVEAVKHLLLEGSTGDGKSTFASFLPHVLYGSWIVIDPHKTPNQWRGLPCVGGGRNYEQIAETLTAIHELMIHRFKLRDKGLDVGGVLNIIIDEYPAIAASDECKDIAAKVLKQLSREARKVGMRLIILVQGSEVKALGIEGEGSVRENFARIHCGKAAKKFAANNERLSAKLKALPYCYLLDGEFLDVPDLSNVANNGVNYEIQPLPPELANFVSVPQVVDFKEQLEDLLGLPEAGKSPELGKLTYPLSSKDLPDLPSEEVYPVSGEKTDPTADLPDWFLNLPETKQRNLYYQLKALREEGISDSKIIQDYWGKGGKYYQGAKAVINFLEVYYAGQ